MSQAQTRSKKPSLFGAVGGALSATFGVVESLAIAASEAADGVIMTSVGFKLDQTEDILSEYESVEQFQQRLEVANNVVKACKMR